MMSKPGAARSVRAHSGTRWRLAGLWLRAFLACLTAITLTALAVGGGEPGPTTVNPYSQWTQGPPTDLAFFPIAVWLQPPAKAELYRAAGFNTYVGLWRGPTEDQLAALKRAGLKVVCEQNEVALKHLDDPTIIGWMHGDEPDNAQARRQGEGYGPPIPPAEIVRSCQRLRARDPSRPVLLNLGQGVAWDGWHGRGVRTNHPEDYPEYLRGCDVASFDIYPVVHTHPDVQGQLGFVAKGVQRLREWTRDEKVVWNCLECTRISNPQTKATPHQVRAEAWMSLIHGSRGLIYFVHEWKPKFNESALLSDPEMLAAVTALNHQISRLAPVLYQPNLAGRASVRTREPEAQIALAVRQYQHSLYVFAVNMRAVAAAATFRMTDNPKTGTVEVLDEQRRLPLKELAFEDQFTPWDVHLYRLPLKAD